MKLSTIYIPPEAIAKLSKLKMSGAVRWKKITSHPLFSPLLSLQPNPPQGPSNPTPHPAPNPALKPAPNTSRFLANRLRDVFPPGLEGSSKSSPGGDYSFAPHHLLRILNDNLGSDQHVEQTVVKSAWYGKQTKSARHEFIVVHVEDQVIGLENCIALDRNQGQATSNVATMSSRAEAKDAFRVSFDGDLDRFLTDSKLGSYLKLEELQFHASQPLLLLDLVSLVAHVSHEHPVYHPMDTNCYWFTGLIWECLRDMCPTAKYDICLEGSSRRGKIGYVRCVPNPVQVWNVLREVRATFKNVYQEPPSQDDLASEDQRSEIDEEKARSLET